MKTRLVLAVLVSLTLTAFRCHGAQTVSTAVTYGAGSALTIQTGVTANFAAGSIANFAGTTNFTGAVDFTHATVTGIGGGSGGGVTDGTKGDIVISGSGSTYSLTSDVKVAIGAILPATTSSTSYTIPAGTTLLRSQGLNSVHTLPAIGTSAGQEPVGGEIAVRNEPLFGGTATVKDSGGTTLVVIPYNSTLPVTVTFRAVAAPNTWAINYEAQGAPLQADNAVGLSNGKVTRLSLGTATTFSLRNNTGGADILTVSTSSGGAAQLGFFGNATIKQSGNILSALGAYGLVGSPTLSTVDMLGTTAARGLSKEVWLSSKPQSSPTGGQGTAEDPYDCGTTAKLDAWVAANRSTPGMHVHLVGDAFTTITGITIWAAGWTVEGPATVTFDPAVGSSLGAGEARSVIGCAYNVDCGAKVHDLALDANAQNVTGAPIGHNVKNCALNAIYLYGSNNLIYNIHASNTYGSLINNVEGFAIGTEGYYNGSAGVLASNNIIRNCTADSPRGDYQHGIVNSGYHGLKSPGMIGCVINDCAVNNFLPPAGTATITIASPGVITWTGHGLNNGDYVNFKTTGALPTGLTQNTLYYVVNRATNTFQVSLSLGGSAINTSGTQSGVHTVYELQGLTVAFSSNIVTNNTATNCQIGARWEPATSLIVTGNKFLNTRERGISIEDSSGATDVTISGNIIEMRDDDPAREWGIYMSGATNKNVNISGNIIRRKSGADTSPDKRAIVTSTTTGQGISVTNNKIDTDFASAQLPADVQPLGNRKLDNAVISGVLGDVSQLYDASGVTSVDPWTRGLFDASGLLSIDWDGRIAYGDDGMTKSFAWQPGAINIGLLQTGFGTIGLDSSSGGDGIYIQTHAGAIKFQAKDTGDVTMAGTLELLSGGAIKFDDSSYVTKLLTTNGSGVVSPIANTSAGLFSFISDKTGVTTGSVIVGSINPIILRPTSAMSSHVVDITKTDQTESISAGTTLTLSGVPVAGQTFGWEETADSTARVVTLPSGTWKSVARGNATVTTVTIPASTSQTFLAYCVSTGVFKLYGEPITINDLATKTTPIEADLLSLYDTAGGVEAKSTVLAVKRLKGYTVATLPASPTQGDTAFVTDASSPTHLGALTGGSSTVAPVFYNGTAWVSY